MDIQKNKQKLEEELKLLEEELGSLGKIDSDTKEWVAVPEEQTMPEPDMNDLSDRSEDYEEKSSTLKVLKTRWEDIKIALEKIKKDDYGMCEVCGEKIEEERLIVNPSARTCEKCMEKVI
jgi:RNA polymerase-binding transcription factor DksA